MTTRSLFATVLFALAAGSTSASAQDLARSTTRGFHIGGGINGSSIEVDDEDLGGETENGGGLYLAGGYNFTPRLGLLLTVSGASMNTDSDAYALGQADLAGRFSFANPARALVPYLELGFTGLSAQEETDAGTLELSGTGITGAVGVNYFFSPKLALDANFRFTRGEFDTVKVGGESFTGDDGVKVNTGRLNVGVSFFP